MQLRSRLIEAGHKAHILGLFALKISADTLTSGLARRKLPLKLAILRQGGLELGLEHTDLILYCINKLMLEMKRRREI